MKQPIWQSGLLATLFVVGSCTRTEPQEQILRILSWNTFNLPTIAGEMGQVNIDELTVEG